MAGKYIDDRPVLERMRVRPYDRVAAVLELVRRLDAVLHHVARPLERHTVVCDRSISIDAVADPVERTRSASQSSHTSLGSPRTPAGWNERGGALALSDITASRLTPRRTMTRREGRLPLAWCQ